MKKISLEVVDQGLDFYAAGGTSARGKAAEGKSGEESQSIESRFKSSS